MNTILSGFIGESNGTEERSFNVVQVDVSVLSSSMDGFTIVNGEADGINPQDKQGGAIFCEGNIELNNIKMINNTSELAGSNICTNGSSGNLVLRNSQIIPMNFLVPAISVDNNSKVHVAESCTIQEN